MNLNKKANSKGKFFLKNLQMPCMAFKGLSLSFELAQNPNSNLYRKTKLGILNYNNFISSS